MPLLDGFNDDDLHNNIVEAVKVLAARRSEYERAVESINNQYLKALEASHDGTDAACTDVLTQIAAVRSKF